MMDAITSQLIDLALEEDIRDGDVTSEYFVPSAQTAVAYVKVKDEGVFAGGEIAREVCRRVDASIEVEQLIEDGEVVTFGALPMKLTGSARSILTAERTVLNFLQRLSGVASKTYSFTTLVSHTDCEVLDTRKTTPGWRWLEKMAVRAGGGINHRMGLYDRAMVKDNHLIAEGGLDALQKAIDTLKGEKPAVEIELEADTLEQVKSFLTLSNVDYILLDNMPPARLIEAVQLRGDASVKLEASGGVNLDTVKEIAETGVDFVSVGALTHSAIALDISLDFRES